MKSGFLEAGGDQPGGLRAEELIFPNNETRSVFSDLLVQHFVARCHLSYNDIDQVSEQFIMLLTSEHSCETDSLKTALTTMFSTITRIPKEEFLQPGGFFYSLLDK